MTTIADTDIIVAGAGPAGMIAALSFSCAGFSVALAGPLPAPDDRRTTALMTPALGYLDGLGLADPLKKGGAPLAGMRIVDATSRLVRSPTVTFRASEIGEEAFGFNIPNDDINRVLVDALKRRQAVTRHENTVVGWRLDHDRATAELDDGRELTARLVVAADGRGSAARKAAGIGARMHRHRQSALVLTFSHQRDHGNISTEFHTETGPFTQVPLPGKRSSLVWVLRPAVADGLSGASDDLVAARIEERMQSMLGKVSVEPGRQVYPLSSALPSRFAANRIALVGEAAHLFPPIGAQGLNLGIRDVQDLVATALAQRDDPGSPAAALRYDMKRRPDVLARSGAVTLLNLSLLSDFLPAQVVRSAGLGLLGGFAPVRTFFMREGLRPGSGWSSLLSGVRQRTPDRG